MIIESTPNLTSLTFSRCIIDSEGIVFNPEIKYKLTNIHLNQVGSDSYSKWPSNPSLLCSILCSISECCLNNTITNISIYNCGLSRNQVLDMAVEYNLKGIKIIGSKRYIKDRYRILIKD
mmetsp:Transcript_18791/g.16634  ORF Transcript_18791/g.16634 Transcript_18791/m.16634 type:complete len:120 (+) Transcript_18791:64-423(+)